MADHGPPLTEREKNEAQERSTVHATVIHEAIREDGERELIRPAEALAWSGLAAGLSMSFSLIAEAAIAANIPDVPYRPVISKLGYSVGFLIVILGKQQLFTENTLTVILPLMSRRDWPTLRGVLRLWAIVLAANIAGAHLISWTLVSSSALDAPLREAVLRISEQATDAAFGAALIKGVFAGWLIALIVWLRAAVDSGEVAIIVILTYVVALGGFTHVIVGSIESLCLVFAGSKTWIDYALGYFLPSLIGNILGGVSLVAALNHAQVVAGQAERG